MGKPAAAPAEARAAPGAGPPREAQRFAHVRRPVDALVPHARNARTHPEAQVSAIAASIREFGFTNPVLIDEHGNVIAGHGRIMAARKLGLADVPCVIVPGLTEPQRRALVLSDNRIALSASWDAEMLGLELADLQLAGFDLELTGFAEHELDVMIEPPAPPVTSTKELDPDAYELGHKCPKCGFEFDA